MMLTKMLSLINKAITLCAQYDFHNEYGDNIKEFAKCFNDATQEALNLPPKIQHGIEGALMGILSVNL